MEDYFIENFEELSINHPNLILKLNDFEAILKIFSSDKLINENQYTVWQVMHDWIKFDTLNRLKYFKQLFKNCPSFDNLPLKFVESCIFRSDIFKQLSLEFQRELIKYVINRETKPLLVCIEKKNGVVQFYDHRHSSWHISSLSLQLPNNQYYFELALLDSVLYAFGGKDNNNDVTNKMWSRDLSDPSSQWTARADMNQERVVFSSVVLNDAIYVLGGMNKNDDRLISCERYDSQLNQWSTVADMNSGRVNSSAAVINGCIYIAGGGNEKGKVEQSVEKYDPQTNTWSQVAPMTTDRIQFALTPFAGRLWAIGGWNDNRQLCSCESYDPVTDTWREETPIKDERRKYAAIEFNGELYVAGGRINNVTTDVEKYVPAFGWVKDSSIKHAKTPELLIIPNECSFIFTTYK